MKDKSKKKENKRSVFQEQPSLITPPNEKQMKTLDPTWSDYNLFKFTAPVEKHNAPRQNFTDAILLENTRQKKTVAQVYPVKNDLKQGLTRRPQD
nr:unnamed protein product [Callosobruchus chinensis]